MATLGKALRYTLPFEGGYFDSVHDSGGATRFGIVESVARQHGYTGPMQKLPKSLAIQIYRSDYWNPLNIEKVNQKIANAVFDMGVNAGIRTGSRVFQAALNNINVLLRGNDVVKLLYPALKVDGRIGPITLDAYRIIAKRRELRLLLKWIDVHKANFYEACSENPRKKNKDGVYIQKGFIRSWSRRFFV